MEQKVVLITGVSSGMGRAAVEELCGQGHRVYGTTRSLERYHARNTAPRGAEIIEVDLADDTSVKKAVSGILRREKGIDVLVNNAGYGIAGAAEETPIDEAKAQFEINFFALARMTAAVLPLMRANRSGLVINISSIVGLMGIPFQAFYCASKYAVEGYTESLRMEVKRFGIDVTMIEPGDVKSGFTANRVKTTKTGSGGAYDGQFDSSISIVEKDETGKGYEPEKVARLIAGIMNEKRPKLRYPIGAFDQMISLPLKKILPQKMFESIIMQHLKMK